MSSRTSTSWAPAFTMGSTAMTRPDFIRLPESASPKLGTCGSSCHLAARPVAHELADHRIALRFLRTVCIAWPKIAQALARADAGPMACSRPPRRWPPGGADLSGGTLPTSTVRAGVGAEAVLEDAEADPDDVTVLRGRSLFCGDAVHDHVVDRRAHQHGRVRRVGVAAGTRSGPDASRSPRGRSDRAPRSRRPAWRRRRCPRGSRRRRAPPHA